MKSAWIFALVLSLMLVKQDVAANPAVALTGTVVSQKDGPMEGVAIIARREGDTVLTAVYSDSMGRFSFPRDHVSPGHYAVTIRAAGYELPNSDTPMQVLVGGSSPVRLRIPLVPVTDPWRLASQLTSLEWANSFPGTDAQKDVLMRNIVNCAFCHSLERVARSSHSAAEFRQVIQRMQTYDPDHSGPVRMQIGAPSGAIGGMLWWGRDAKLIAEYLATVNLSGGRTKWDYNLRTLPRPSGEATKAIVTVYPIPRQPSVIHDLDVDSKGNVWYGNSGWDFLGRLDPRTGAFSEWEAPNFLPDPAPGTDRILGVQDIQVDGEDHVWVAVGGNKLSMFVPETHVWRKFDLPVIWKNPFLSPLRRGERGLWVTGITAPPDGDKRHEHAFRLDTVTGKLDAGIMLFDDKPTPVDPDRAHALNYCYMMDQDADGHFLCTTPEASAIARADANGNVRLIPTPTPRAYPRRGYRDAQNRFWFGEFLADKIGVIDLNTDRITEYAAGARYIQPYYARPDRDGHVWTSSTGSDRLLRLDPQTGGIVQYLMPVNYDARKVVVDLSAKGTTIWLPDKNLAQLIRVEVPE